MNNQPNINGAAFDSAGNETAVGGFSFSYDAENRMSTSSMGSSGLTAYQYDGDGRRVVKVDCPAGTAICLPTTAGSSATWYFYDASGRLAVQNSTGPMTSSCTTCFVLPDHLGSTRVLTDANGNAAECHDYQPFGGELLGGINGRSGCYAAGPANGVLFTRKLRDAETQTSAMPSGLDCLGARYYSGAMGRFTSPDPFMIMTQADNRHQLDAYLGNPQNWNRYAYALNNPLRYIDPAGLDPISVEDCQKDSTCTVVKLSVILNTNANIFDSKGNLRPEYQSKLDTQVAQAADEYGNANIAFDVGSPIKAAVDSNYVGEAGAINVVVTDSNSSGSLTSRSWVGPSGASYTRLNIGTSLTSTYRSTLAHHLTGDTRSWGIPFLSNIIADENNDLGRAILRNWNTSGGTVLRSIVLFYICTAGTSLRMPEVGVGGVQAMTVSTVFRAMPILLRSFRPVFRLMAWGLFLLLAVCWVIEAVHSVESYAAGGWPAVIGYVQHIGEGHNPDSMTWSRVIGIHVGALSITLLLGL